ncbi:MAG: biotin--[acetyl-CoA-carboxylase] ligase [Bacteroidaceae bacterium]|nr:biotin--[acetyl-CoA-carboxylase] ligase [Bacteroidaceae bacterium]
MKEYKIKRHRLQTVHSTNSFLRELNGGDASFDMELATTEFQTVGRGQKGNSWESEKSKNLLFSILLHPVYVQPSKQFCISEAIALAVVKSLKEIVADESVAKDFSVKWPNDIYWKNKKIAGILIENELFGSTIRDCIVGVGININQQIFLSDAPNPVSLYNILGVNTNVEEVLDAIIKQFVANVSMIENGQTALLHKEYMDSLFRRKGIYPYRDCSSEFMATIKDVREDGRLILIDSDNKERIYEFKEVAIVL